MAEFYVLHLHYMGAGMMKVALVGAPVEYFTYHHCALIIFGLVHNKYCAITANFERGVLLWVVYNYTEYFSICSHQNHPLDSRIQNGKKPKL